MATFVPSMTAVVMILMAVFLAFQVSSHSGNMALIGYVMLTLQTSAIVFTLYVSYTKFVSYKKARRDFERRGWNVRLASVLQNTWCDRRLVVQAASDCGFGDEARQFYYDLGYRLTDVHQYQKSGMPS